MQIKLEGKAERFKRIATKRTVKVLEALRLLGNCGNRGTYTYTKEEVNRIFGEVRKTVKDAESQFAKSEKHKFSL